MESAGNSGVSLRGCMDKLHLGNMLHVGIWQAEILGAQPVFSIDVDEVWESNGKGCQVRNSGLLFPLPVFCHEMLADNMSQAVPLVSSCVVR